MSFPRQHATQRAFCSFGVYSGTHGRGWGTSKTLGSVVLRVGPVSRCSGPSSGRRTLLLLVPCCSVRASACTCALQRTRRAVMRMAQQGGLRLWSTWWADEGP